MPASVAFTVRPARRTSVVPIASSSDLTRAATAAGVRSRRRAASAIEPQSTTITKLCRNCVSIRNKTSLSIECGASPWIARPGWSNMRPIPKTRDPGDIP